MAKSDPGVDGDMNSGSDEEEFDWVSFAQGGAWIDEFPGLREALDRKAAEQMEKRQHDKG